MPGVSEATDSILTLEAGDLLRSYGFGDGDACDFLVAEWACASWPQKYVGSDPQEVNFQWSLFRYVNSRIVLGLAIRRLLEPVCRDAIEGFQLTREYGLGNPFVLVGSHGVVVPEDPDDTTPVSAIERIRNVPSVEVSRAEFFALCEDAYPERSLGWLELVNSLANVWNFSMNLPRQADPLLQFASLGTGAFVDTFASVMSEDALLLAAEQIDRAEPDLASRREPPYEAIYELLKGVHLVANPATSGLPLPSLDTAIGAASGGLLPRVTVLGPGGPAQSPARPSVRIGRSAASVGAAREM